MKTKLKPHDSGHWPESKKQEVVVTYLSTGSVTETAKTCNVPPGTITQWKRSEWWKEIVDAIQSDEGQRTDNKISSTIDKALDLILDRMDTGDFQYDQRTGRMVKIPLKARDLERVASGLFDKRQLIRKQPTNIKASDLGQADRLLALAEQFAAMAGKPKEVVIDGEYVDESNG